MHFGLKLLQGISALQVERDSNNEVVHNLAPLVMSFQLVEMAPCDFIDLVLDPYQSQLAKFWPDEKIDLIERHQQELLNAYRGNSAPSFSLIKRIIQRSSIRDGMI